MTDFLKPIADNLKRNPTPIILIDVSGSTDDELLNGRNVRNYEFELASELLKKYETDNARIICWSDRALAFDKLSDMEEMEQLCQGIKSGTHLMCGLELIKETHFKDNQITDIIIITDGEIQDTSSELAKKLNQLSKFKINIKIMAVETGTKNYLEGDCLVGNVLYKMVRDQGMIRLINRFSIYNELNKEFVNFSNPIVPDGFIPFRDFMFKRSDLPSFVLYISNSTNEIDKLKEDRKEMTYLKLAHEISLSIYHLIKNKPHHEEMAMIDLFSNMFKKFPDVYSRVRKLLLDEVNNHIAGKSTTFTESRNNRNTNIENNNLSLMENVREAIEDSSASLIDTLYKISFLIRTNKNLYIIKTCDNLVSIHMDKTVYESSGISINLDHNYLIPIMFNPDISNNLKQESCIQWLSLNYSRVLNISPSNDFIYYYFLADAYTVLILNQLDNDIKVMYESCVKTILNSKHEDGTSKMEQISRDVIVKIPYNVLQNCISYTKFPIKPLSLLYLIVSEFILPHIDQPKKETFVDDLRKFCLPEIRQDLELGSDKEVNWDSVSAPLNKLCQYGKIRVVEFNSKLVYILKAHNFANTNICCCDRIIEDDCSFCNICGSKSQIIKLEQKKINTKELLLDSTMKQFYIDTKKHITLGELTGEKINDNLISPDKFFLDYDSMELKNIMIVNPICSTKMRTKNKEEFNELVHQKYPFLKDLDMTNVVLCGGFVRSILLKQQMKDFDFFFYNLNDYDNRFHKLMRDLINSVRKYDPELRFGMFFKPLYNVFELICFEDPQSHIKEDFTLDNFDKYTFLQLRKFDRQANIENDEYYFEDNDEKGIKMRYRFQFILCKYKSIFDILNSFDMFPSKVAYDGKDVYFTEKSLRAYQFMINEISLEGYSELFKHRLNKYFKYGFSIVFPKNNRAWYKENFDNKYNNYRGSLNENEGPLCFKVRKMTKNIIYINHNSNIEMLMERRNQALEKTALEAGKALYISSLFCSFVSFLRYAKINGINYSFPQYPNDGTEINIPMKGSQFELKTATVTINFLDRINVKNRDSSIKWYDEFVESMILTAYE